jgi:hypothetical protein
MLGPPKLEIFQIFHSLKGNQRLSVSSWLIVVCFFLFSLDLIFLFFHKGTEFKCATCPITGVMLLLEIQYGKLGMKDQQHHRVLRATAGCTVRMSERCAQVKGVQVHFSGEAEPRGVPKGLHQKT